MNLKALFRGGAARQDLHPEPYEVVCVPHSGIAAANLFVDQSINHATPFRKAIDANIGDGDPLT